MQDEVLNAKIKEIYNTQQTQKGILWKKLSIYHHAKSNEHIVFDMKTPFNGKMVFFAAISLHTLIVRICYFLRE